MTQALSTGMAIQINSNGPDQPGSTTGVAQFNRAFASSTLDAAGERHASIGRLVWADRGTHTISAAGGGSIILYFSSSTVFADAGSSLTIGIQDIVAGGPNPDDTFDVSATKTGGASVISAGFINQWVMDTGSKTIATNDIIALVCDLTARVAPDAVLVNNNNNSGGNIPGFPYCRFRTGGAWGLSSVWPNILIQADDGVYGWIQPFGFRTSANLTTSTFNSTSGTFDELGMRFMLPWPATLEGITVGVSGGASSDFEYGVYTDIFGTPTLIDAADTFDASIMGTAGGTVEDYTYLQFATPKVLAANTPYGWSIRPTSANNVVVSYTDWLLSAGVSANFAMASLPMGDESYAIRRLNNTGAFTAVDSVHIPHTLHLSKFDAGDSRSNANILRGSVIA